MKIDCLILGAYETNCYILRRNESSADCLIIDTGLNARVLIDFLAQNNLKPAAVVLTHGHADHITGLIALRKDYPDAKVCIHKLDADMLADPVSNLSSLAGATISIGAADCLLDEPGTIEQANIKLEVLHTPGHTPGGICLYSKDENLVFVGDTLFAESVGRTDMPGGSSAQLINSIKQKLLTLPDDTAVYPGHGPETTIRHEKSQNPFLK